MVQYQDLVRVLNAILISYPVVLLLLLPPSLVSSGEQRQREEERRRVHDGTEREAAARPPPPPPPLIRCYNCLAYPDHSDPCLDHFVPRHSMITERVCVTCQKMKVVVEDNQAMTRQCVTAAGANRTASHVAAAAAVGGAGGTSANSTGAGGAAGKWLPEAGGTPLSSCEHVYREEVKTVGVVCYCNTDLCNGGSPPTGAIYRTTPVLLLTVYLTQRTLRLHHPL